MLISTSTTLALICSICGKMDYYPLSRFQVNGQKSTVFCQCGALLLSMSLSRNNQYLFYVECYLCEVPHAFSYPVKAIWSDQLITLVCPETGVEIGFIGPKDKIDANIENLDKTVREMADELGYGDYFNNPEIMYKVLEHLYGIANQKKILCSCGNINLDMEIYPDRMEMHCNYCGAVGIVFAESLKDWENVRSLTEIVLVEGVYKYLDDKSFAKKPKNKLK